MRSALFYALAFLSQQRYVACVVLFHAVVKANIDDIHVHTLRLFLAVEAAIPTSAIQRCGFEDRLAPAVVEAHFEAANTAAQELTWIEVIVVVIAVWC